MRISNCSRASLWTKLERLTVHRLISVGSGTGPTMTASKRAAVSIICLTERSRILCSYARTRIRSLCSVGAVAIAFFGARFVAADPLLADALGFFTVAVAILI